MSWYLFAAHRTAHILPTVTSGTVSTGKNEKNLGTLDLDHRTVVLTTAKLEFDRSTATSPATRADVNALVVMAHNTQSKQTAMKAYYGTSAGFVWMATQYAAQDGWFWYYSETPRDEQIWTFEAQVIDETEFGCVSFGTAYDLGNPILARRMATAGGGPYDGRVISATFTKLSAATVTEIEYLLAQRWLTQIDGAHVYDGLGGWGGRNPLALYDGNNAELFWGSIVNSEVENMGGGQYALSITLRERLFDIAGSD